MNVGITLLVILIVPLLFQVFYLSIKVGRMKREMNAHFSKRTSWYNNLINVE